MTNSIYVAAAGQMALAERLNTVAFNLANISTVGFRAEHVEFRSILANVGGDQISFPNRGSRSLATSSGALRQTGNMLDVAVRGDGWLAIRTESGIAFTRDGRLRVSPNGTLQTITGFPVLDAGRAVIQAEARGGTLSISRDGSVSQGGQPVGAIGVFGFPAGTSFSRGPASTVIPSKEGVVMLDFDKYGLEPGHVESANNDPVHDVTRLMVIQRAFEMLSNSIDMIDSSKREFIRSSGPQTGA